MSTMRLTIALSAFLVHIEAHVCLPVKPPCTTTKFHLEVYRRLLTITRLNMPFQRRQAWSVQGGAQEGAGRQLDSTNPGKPTFADTLRGGEILNSLSQVLFDGALESLSVACFQ